MLECSVCGLLFTATDTCPSCGSTIAEEIRPEGMLGSDFDIPGLDDLAQTVGDDEIEESVSKPKALDSNLPFGLGAESSVTKSSLPFGIGSAQFSHSMDVLPHEGEDSDLKSDHEEDISDEEDTTSLVVDSPKNETKLDDDDDDLQSSSPPESIEIEEIAPTNEVIEILPDLPDFQQPDSTALSGLDSSMDMPEIPSIEAEVAEAESTVLVKMSAVPIQETSLQESPAKIQAETVSKNDDDDSLSFGEEGVPDIWRIDAQTVDMEAIYQEEDVTVEIEYEDSYDVSEINVDLDRIHEVVSTDGGSDHGPPQLHQAHALPINTTGSPELEQLVTTGFQKLVDEDYDGAAKNFQRLAQQVPGQASILNNYGLALLHKAIKMEQSSNAEDTMLAPTQFESAIMALRQAAKSEPSNDVLLLNLSHALLVSGRHEKTLGVIQVYRDRRPNDVEGANIEASALIQLGRMGEAKKILSEHVQDDVVKLNLERLVVSA